MNILNKTMTGKKPRPIKVIQFGEGNFLRAFADYMIDIANGQGAFDGDIVLVKPTSSPVSLEHFHRQDCQYTVSLRGNIDGEGKICRRIVTSIADIVNPYTEYEKYLKLAELETLRFVISNTTEAGIVFDCTDKFEPGPPKSFPGKLTGFLYHRFEFFHGALDKGLIMLPTELVDDNGSALKNCVLQLIRLWNLPGAFEQWVKEACVFASTLVDRIVTGYPKAKEVEEWEALGYEDHLMVVCEPFALWVIEADQDFHGEFNLPAAGLPVLFAEDHHPYKQRKVRILNGAHTSFALASWLCGNNIVRQSMEDPDIFTFMERTIFDEVIPTLTLPEKELTDFAKEIINRFNNPYVDHALLDISLNSVSKWKTRCLPSLLDYQKQFGKLPPHLTFSLAALMTFYHGTELRNGILIGHRDGQEYPIRDDKSVLEFFRDNYGCAHNTQDTLHLTMDFLSRKEFWEWDLNEIPGLADAVAAYLDDIREHGMRNALRRVPHNSRPPQRHSPTTPLKATEIDK